MSDFLHYEVWSRPDDEGGDDFPQHMLVDMPRGRCITSVSWRIADVPKRGTLRLWCRQVEPGVMLTGHILGDVERPSYYRDEGATTYWKWRADGEEFPFARVDPAHLPDWFADLLQVAHAKMDVAERDGTDLRRPPFSGAPKVGDAK